MKVSDWWRDGVQLTFELTNEQCELRTIDTREKSATVRLYADEIKKIRNREGQFWMYFGLLAIPDVQRSYALESLEQDRTAGQYFGELKSTNLTQRPKIEVAKRWLRRVMYDERKCFHFYVLGLKLDNLQYAAFGDTANERRRHIYNRFFRACVAYTLKRFFGESKQLEVSAVFHDRTELEHDEWFDWHTIWKLGMQEEGIAFQTQRIAFIDSDHGREQDYPEESHLIQLIDVILGSIRECLDYTSDEEGIKEVAKEFLPLVERLTDERRCNNPHSRYRYHRRCCLSFFPSKRLKLEDLDDPWKRGQSSFFVQRRLLLAEKLSGQQSLLFES